MLFRPVSPDVLPDYMPAIAKGVLADQDNQLWIPLAPTMLPPATRIYDIVDRSGKLVDRVRVDPTWTIVGFGKGGDVYVFIRDAGKG